MHLAPIPIRLPLDYKEYYPDSHPHRVPIIISMMSPNSSPDSFHYDKMIEDIMNGGQRVNESTVRRIARYIKCFLLNNWTGYFNNAASSPPATTTTEYGYCT